MAGAGRPGPGGRSRGAVAGRSGGREAGARRPEPEGRGREVVAGKREPGGRKLGAGMPAVRGNFGG